MATTTNYGWTTPDDTALVKDGAAAIRTLGTSVDTTTKNLNPSTTLGDIEYRSSTANTNTRLGIGTSGQVLTVSGGVPAWTTVAAAGGMTLISTTTLSSADTTISSIPQTYKSLQIIVFGMTANTSDEQFMIGLNASTNLVDQSGTRNNAGSYSAQGVENGRITLTSNTNTLRTNANNAWVVNIYNYASTTSFKPFEASGFWVGGASTNQSMQIGGAFRSTTAISSLVFRYASNSYTAGTVLLYGVN
jgi:hypothetical protein